MKPKTTLILFVVLIGVGAFYYLWGIKGEAKREARKERQERILPMLEPSEVNRVELFQNDELTVAYERENGRWMITDPVRTGPDTSKLSSNLESFLQAEKKRTISTELTDLKPYGLDRPEARIRISYRDTGQVELIVGDKTPTKSDVFVKREDSPAIYTAASKVNREGTKELFDLRDRSIINADRQSITRVVLDRGDSQSLEFTKMGNDWRLEEPQVRVSSSQINSMLRTLTTNKFQEVHQESPDDPGEYGIESPEIRVSLFSSDTTREAVLLVGKPVDDSNSPDYYGRDLSRPMIFSIGNSMVTKMQKEPFEYQDKTLFDVSRSQITDLEISWNDTTYSVSKVDTIWKITAPSEHPAREGEIRTLTSKLTSLKVDELGSYTETSASLYGLDSPWMRVKFNIAGSEFDGFRVGDETGEEMRYISTDSSPYVYKIEESKLEDFQISLGDLTEETEADTGAVTLETE